MHLKSSQEIIELPLFPLQTILFPDGVIALKIFEARYLDMMKNCLRNQGFFGVIGIMNEAPEGKATAANMLRLAEMGTLAKIADFDAVEPALYMTRSVGAQRFKLLSAEQMKDGLWIGQVELLSNDPQLPIPEELSSVASLLSEIMTAFHQQVDDPKYLPFQAPFRLNDCGWVANRFAELLPLTIFEKVHLLSQVNPRIRLDLISEIIDDGRLNNSVLH
jgi:Lon protease-like protein